MRRPGVGLALTFALALAACSGDSATTTVAESVTTSTAAESSTTQAETTTSTVAPIGVSGDFARAVIQLDGLTYTVAVADTPRKLSQGLMGVEELSPLDGMLFVYNGERVVSHWMKDTPIALDIAFFNAAGFLVSRTSMPICLEDDQDDCPSYPAEGPAAFSVEVPVGGFEDLPDDARLVIIGDLDGSGKEI